MDLEREHLPEDTEHLTLNHRIWTQDPISGNDVKNLESAPFVIDKNASEGDLKIYFENEANRDAYLRQNVEKSGKDMTHQIGDPHSDGPAEG